MSPWMFNCGEVTRLASTSLDTRLPFFQRLGIRIHFMMCKLCPQAFKQLLFLREASQLLAGGSEELVPGQVRLPAAARERMKSALRS